jgi:Tol biopolymer transport system component
MQPSGENVRQITRDSYPDADPRFSPDGKHILYTSLRSGLPEIWRMNRNGSDLRFVTKGAQASWAPDGLAIVFIRDNQTYVRDLESGKERCVAPANLESQAGPAWSPDGKQLAVGSRHLGSIRIFLVEGEGTTAAPLKTEEPCCTPHWSPDGKKILCQTVQGHICQVDRDGKNWEQLTFGADLQHNACYSPDGSMILFCRASDPEGPWQICVKKLDGDEYDFTQITREGTNLSPDWHAAEH